MMPKTDTAALAWLDSRAERLLEAVESLLEVVQPPVPCVELSLSILGRASCP